MPYGVETFSSTVVAAGLRIEFDIKSETPSGVAHAVAYLDDGKHLSGTEFDLSRELVGHLLQAFNDLYHVMGS